MNARLSIAVLGGALLVSPPHITGDRIPFGKERKHEMAAYSKRHYGHRTWRLRNPKVIVLHYTTSATYRPVWNTFASNAPVLGELPGTCAHFVIGKGGTIHRLVPLRIQCRHTVGLNYTAIGIEMVQEQLASSHRSDLAILHRRAQIHAALHLVRWLQARYGIATRNVIGHAMANRSPYFKDHEGWRNDHTDWQHRDVVAFRRRLSRLGSSAKAPSQRRIVFGRSVRGRPLVAVRSGDAGARRAALVVGQIHGDEPAGRKVIRALRARNHLPHDLALWTVKTVNPDGNRLDTRQNAHGVDLNRNFSYRWRRAEPPTSRYYQGPHPFSEPESRAVRRLVRRIRPDVSIWYHQPWGAVLRDPCHGPNRIQRRYARLVGMPLSCRGANLPGTAIDWENHREGGKAFVVEFGPGSLSDSAARRNARAAVRVAAGR
jgi:hypothetical protein